MLCEKCNLNNATVHLKQTVNGETKDIYLCASCAGEGELGISFNNLLQSFLESFFGQQGGVAYESKTHTPQGRAVKCASCGTSYDDFKKSGKLGCANCYSSFKNELEFIIKNIQGSNVHEGKFPKRSGQEFIQKREVERLRAELRRAIDEEQFETAAKIRDEIKERSKANE
ncbi:MAG: UvrB/UvrC motif-containing protein [Clostridiales bacterium]|jgi:protein arginine kinase activator|nr:UvrB/UvrC motif-containing protein [Clostridiales bacterium]